MKKNLFDFVMDYIDVNINLKPDEIRKGMLAETNVNSNSFNQCLLTLAGITLHHYIICRKLYFASEALYNNPEANIVDIALEYYSDQSAFNRAMKNYYDCTPGEIKAGTKRVPDEKLKLEDFSSKKNESRVEHILQMIEEHGCIGGYNLECLEAVERAVDEYGFDIDTVYAISNLAEHLEMPIPMLIEACAEIYRDYQMDIQSGSILPLKVELAVDCGISSDEELKEICEFYNCTVYDLDGILVRLYHENKDKWAK